MLVASCSFHRSTCCSSRRRITSPGECVVPPPFHLQKANMQFSCVFQGRMASLQGNMPLFRESMPPNPGLCEDRRLQNSKRSLQLIEESYISDYVSSIFRQSLIQATYPHPHPWPRSHHIHLVSKDLDTCRMFRATLTKSHVSASATNGFTWTAQGTRTNALATRARHSTSTRSWNVLILFIPD